MHFLEIYTLTLSHLLHQSPWQQSDTRPLCALILAFSSFKGFVASLFFIFYALIPFVGLFFFVFDDLLINKMCPVFLYNLDPQPKHHKAQ